MKARAERRSPKWVGRGGSSFLVFAISNSKFIGVFLWRNERSVGIGGIESSID